MTAPQIDPILHPGALVGEYEITHRLGEGGMGVVYAAIHPEIGKRVAIKVLAPHAAQHADLIRRFKEEARAVNKIRHPNIIDIFAFNQLSDGRHYFVMEYLDGESLAARLEHGSMPLAEIRVLLAQICSALQAAHEAGIIHRDLKPDNVWVATRHLAQSEVKLLDFGIAKLNDVANIKATQTGAAIGTPHYMAPEQAMGKPVDHRADIYALGVVLYQIFAGTLPFEGATVHEIVFKHVTEAPRPPSELRPIVPAGMEAIMLECLQKDPARRPSSMRELAERIEAAFAAPSGAQRQTGAVVPPLARGSTGLRAPTPGRTELLPEPSRGRAPSVGHTTPLAAALLASRPRPRHESAQSGWNPPETKRGWGWPLMGLGALSLGVLGALAVGFGVIGRPSPNPTESVPSVGHSRSATAPAARPAAADPVADPAANPAGRPNPEPQIEPPLRADSPPPVFVARQPHAAPTAAAQEPALHHEKKRKPSRKPSDASAHAPPAAGAEHESAATPTAPPLAKPSCNPNFYLDAQGDKHFKPECF